MGIAHPTGPSDQEKGDDRFPPSSLRENVKNYYSVAKNVNFMPQNTSDG